MVLCLLRVALHYVYIVAMEVRTLGSLGLEFQVVVNHHVGAGNYTWVSCKSSSALNH